MSAKEEKISQREILKDILYFLSRNNDSSVASSTSILILVYPTRQN